MFVTLLTHHSVCSSYSSDLDSSTDSLSSSRHEQMNLVKKYLGETAMTAINSKSAKRILKSFFKNSPELTRQSITIPAGLSDLLTIPVAVLFSVLATLALASKFNDKNDDGDYGQKKKVKVVYVPQPEPHYGWR